MSITLKWSPISGADITTFKIFRSMIGFVTPNLAPYGLINGDDLKLKINGEATQTVTFDQNYNADDMVTYLNTKFEDIVAYKSADSEAIYIRTKLREAGCSIEIVGGSAMAKMGLSARVIGEQTEFFLIGTNPGDCYEFIDPNGVIQDFYALSTVDSKGNESKRTTAIQAVKFTGDICVVEGLVFDLQGVRRQDVKVTAKIVCPPEQVGRGGYITDDQVSTLTGEDGRFSLPILQGTKVIFEIDDARVSDPVEIPASAIVYFGDLPIYEEYRFADL